MNTTELNVGGMMCEACVSHVTKALETVPGVHRAKVELNPGRAHIEHENADEQALIAAVMDAEYEAEIAR